MTPKLIRRRERRGLRLWNVGLVLALAFAAALVVAAAVFFAGWDLLGARGLRTQRRLDSKTLFDLVKLSFGVVAGAGALVALVVAYRRQRVDEEGALREATRLHTERFTAAVTQLGSESAAVRLGGVHALAGLADDAPTALLRQTCIDVLCAYLRLPYTAKADLPPDDTDAMHAYLALREVRHTIIRLIRDRTAVGPQKTHISWQGHDFDFTGVVFDGGDFSDAQFTGGTVSFDEAEFSAGMVKFTGAHFSGARVSFNGARFSDGYVSFYDAHFSGGTVSFTRAVFAGAGVLFAQAQLSGATVYFNDAQFSGGRINFLGAQFSDAEVHFAHAQFSGGRVDLTMATGSAPIGLVPPPGEPLPPGLMLPDAWLPTAS
ncbi:pentapeptide repeat-containing protein [Streptomyces sp. A1499]|uniref:pentapeptide repeat-containing protein n=1 Tax=Streptomyces sp. A1499 TaxID=2563104 RepID=UPI00109E5DB7|nr:pentapeptide repeat-containing protein [Streptomyces sp. A1499]THC44787.1 pentapeptide repeat-containing protein [Streptomyces sp. A1499]